MPLAEMTIAGIFDCVSCFDSAADEIVRNRSVQNAQSWRSLRACWRRRSGGSSWSAGPCGALSSRCFGLHLRIELAQPLGVRASASMAIGLSTNTGQDRDALLLFEPLQPVEQLFDPADRERRDDDPAAALGGRR